MISLFISDLHLSPNNPSRTALATTFLAEQTADVDRIYLLGDIFNTWLGDDLIDSEYQPFIDQLRQLGAQGIKRYLMVGNRDFMMGQKFASDSGCELLTDPCLIELGDKKALLMHGDSLCIDDLAYQRYRRWVRNRFLQGCFLRMPQSLRQRVSDKIKQQSKQQKRSKTSLIMDVNQAEVNRVMQQYQVDLLIHGHTHRPQIHTTEAQGHRIVLGDWEDKISYLKCDDQHCKLSDHRVPAAQSLLRFA